MANLAEYVEGTVVVVWGWTALGEMPTVLLVTDNMDDAYTSAQAANGTYIKAETIGRF
jgi:hypothetical protein